MNCGTGPVPLGTFGRTVTATSSSGSVTWSIVSGPGSLTDTMATSATYVPPLQGMTAAPVTIRAATSGASADCTLDLMDVRLSTFDPPVVGEGPLHLVGTVLGISAPISWSLTGPGTLSNATATSVDYTPPLDEAAVGQLVTLTETVAGVPYTIDRRLAARRSRGLSLFAWGRAPITTTNGTTILAGAYLANGSTTLAHLTRTGAGLYSVQLEGGVLSAGVATVIVTAESANVCTVQSAAGDTFTVRCVTAAGAAADAAFSFQVTESGTTSNGVVLAFATGGSTGTSVAGAVSLAPGRWYSAVGSLTMTNTAVGTYRVSLPMGTAIGAAQVSALVPAQAVTGGVPSRCFVATISGSDVYVSCVDPAGTPTNAVFNVVIDGRDAVTEAAITDVAVQDPALTAPNGLGAAPQRSQSASGTAPRVRRITTGLYSVEFTPTVRLSSAQTLLATRLEGDGHCAADLVNAFAGTVSCHALSGSLEDAKFQVVLVTQARPSVANVSAFAWVVVSNGNSTLSPGSGLNFNAAGGTMTSTRASAGVYTVSFGGLSLTNSNVQVTAYGANRRCATAGFENSDVYVRCYDAFNGPVDSQFYVTVTSYFRASSARVIAYAQVPATGAAPTPATAAFNPSGTIATARTGTGTYTVTFNGLQTADNQNLVVQAVNSNRACAVSGWTRAPAVVSVQCFDGSGAADSDFSVSVYANQPFSLYGMEALPRSDVLAFAWLDQPGAASYAPYVPLAFNSSTAPITGSRSATGVYAVRFEGLRLGAGLVQVTPTTPTSRCAVTSVAGDTANVRCYDGSGALADSTYVATFLR